MSVQGVWQLQRLALRFCRLSGSSSGMRDFVQEGLVEFARKNPQLQIRTSVVAQKAPVVIGEYADGSTKEVDVKNKDAIHVAEVVQSMRDCSTGVVRRLNKPVVTSRPTVQGAYDPSVTYEGFSLREGKIPAAAAAKQ